MADFQLVNENGSIVAKDPETGETQPVSIGSLETEDVDNTSDVQINGEDVTLSHRVIASTLDPSTIEENQDQLPGGELRDADTYIQVEE